MRLILLSLLVATASFAAVSSARADDKIDCTNALSDSEMQFCANQDFERADRRLNAVYTHIISQLNKDIASRNEDTRKDALERKQRLVASQRAWIAFRDADSELAGIKALGGTLERLEIPGQKRELTVARTKELLDLFGEDLK